MLSSLLLQHCLIHSLEGDRLLNPLIQVFIQRLHYGLYNSSKTLRVFLIGQRVKSLLIKTVEFTHFTTFQLLDGLPLKLIKLRQ